MRECLANRVEEPSDRALHRNGHFGMVPPATQMRRSYSRSLVVLLVIVGLRTASFGDEEIVAPTPAGPNPEIIRALAEVRRQYGPDAVVLEGFLLSNAIQAGSVLETAVTVGDLEERDARKYLTFTVETGIIFNDREIGDDARAGRIWTRVVERSLRMLRSLSLPADGVRFVLGYSHKPYADESDLRAHLGDGHGEAETVVFYIRLGDINELLAAKLDGQQLVDRAVVLVNGTSQRVRVEPPETAPSETPTAVP
jgi:hypothetical protein